MSNREWLRRTVETKGRPCPLRLGDPCPGTRDGCAFWLDEVISFGPETDLQAGCLITFQYVQQHNSVLEATRQNAGLDKVVNTIARASALPLALIERPRKALS